MSPWLTQALAAAQALPTTTAPGAESRWETFFQLLDNEMEHGSGLTAPSSITKELVADADAIGSALTGPQTSAGATGATGATGAAAPAPAASSTAPSSRSSSSP